jgi:radical SAM protein with 4Fe4S-binding SPASM domain
MSKFSPIYERFFKAQRAKDLPAVAAVELTRRCHWDCKFCFIKKNASANELGAEAWKKVFGELREAGVIQLNLTGGDPLLHKEFFGVYQSAVEQGFVVLLLTTGTLFKEAHFELFSTYKPYQIALSVHGTDAETHDRFVGLKGAYGKTVQTIERLRAAGVRMRIASYVSSETDYDKLREQAEGWGASFRPIYKVLPRVDGGLAPCSYRLDDCDYKSILIKHKGVPEPREVSPGSPLCTAGRGKIALQGDGTAFSCLTLRIPFGNLATQTFEEVWKGEARSTFLERLDAPSHACQSCSVRGFCQPCPGMAHSEHGTVDVPAKDRCREAELKREIWKKNRKETA